MKHRNLLISEIEFGEAGTALPMFLLMQTQATHREVLVPRVRDSYLACTYDGGLVGVLRFARKKTSIVIDPSITIPPNVSGGGIEQLLLHSFILMKRLERGTVERLFVTIARDGKHSEQQKRVFAFHGFTVSATQQFATKVRLELPLN